MGPAHTSVRGAVLWRSWLPGQGRQNGVGTRKKASCSCRGTATDVDCICLKKKKEAGCEKNSSTESAHRMLVVSVPPNHRGMEVWKHDLRCILKIDSQEFVKLWKEDSNQYS